MSIPEPLRVAITGGPGSGKSTLIDALATRGVAVREETGRAVIRDQKATGGDGLPWLDRVRFAALMLEREIVSWHAGSGQPGPIFHDRGIPDVIGYLRLEGLTVPDSALAAARTYRYAPLVFFAPHWPEIYRQDAERRQDEALARRTCDAVASAWRGLGYRTIELPRDTVAARLDFVLDGLAAG